ncbi:hypothetical protein RI103_34375 [Paraburkholderia sp. FT54]|uniref:hypothetical protein n=1 Tax=Paraburkholderia sp. FT54 TaxID=3074437 RepID=UPI0028778BDE|nr:hypothetical protein [Paraburkholderia sp. FT54]WNC94972.1 hypothetical protein RI103_34375 [Paraburkholderia sp. FT54]
MNPASMHGSLQTDADGFGAGFTIALAAHETTRWSDHRVCVEDEANVRCLDRTAG